MKEKYRVGIIGAADIVELGHLPVIKNMPQLNVSWVFDKNEKRSRMLSKMYNVPFVSKPALENEDWDQIDICLLSIPYGARKTYIETCAARKIKLYVEKPFAVSLSEHEYYSSLFNPTHLAIGLQRRYYRSLALLKNLVQSEIFGKLKSINFNQGYFQIKGNKSHLADAGLSGGGVIIESAIHILDQILLMTGVEKVTVKEVFGIYEKGLDYDSEFSALLEKNGATIPLTGAVSVLRNLDNGVFLQFEHSRLQCFFNPEERFKIVATNGSKLSFDEAGIEGCINEEIAARSVSSSFFIIWSQFLQSIESETPNLSNGVSSLLTTSFIESIYDIFQSKN